MHQGVSIMAACRSTKHLAPPRVRNSFSVTRRRFRITAAGQSWRQFPRTPPRITAMRSASSSPFCVHSSSRNRDIKEFIARHRSPCYLNLYSKSTIDNNSPGVGMGVISGRKSSAGFAQLFDPPGEDSVGWSLDINKLDAHANPGLDDSHDPERFDLLIFSRQRDPDTRV